MIVKSSTSVIRNRRLRKPDCLRLAAHDGEVEQEFVMLQLQNIRNSVFPVDEPELSYDRLLTGNAPFQVYVHRLRSHVIPLTTWTAIPYPFVSSPVVAREAHLPHKPALAARNIACL